MIIEKIENNHRWAIMRDGDLFYILIWMHGMYRHFYFWENVYNSVEAARATIERVSVMNRRGLFTERYIETSCA